MSRLFSKSESLPMILRLKALTRATEGSLHKQVDALSDRHPRFGKAARFAGNVTRAVVNAYVTMR